MKIVKTAGGKTRIKMTRKEWTDMGKKAGWMKKANDLEGDWDGGTEAVLARFRKIFQDAINQPLDLAEVDDYFEGKCNKFRAAIIEEQLKRQGLWDLFEHDEMEDIVPEEPTPEEHQMLMDKLQKAREGIQDS